MNECCEAAQNKRWEVRKGQSGMGDVSIKKRTYHEMVKPGEKTAKRG